MADQITTAFTRVDMTFKQGITDNFYIFMNISNATNLEDGSIIKNSSIDQGFDRRLFNQSEKYGLTADFGVRLQLE